MNIDLSSIAVGSEADLPYVPNVYNISGIQFVVPPSIGGWSNRELNQLYAGASLYPPTSKNAIDKISLAIFNQKDPTPQFKKRIYDRLRRDKISEIISQMNGQQSGLPPMTPLQWIQLLQQQAGRGIPPAPIPPGQGRGSVPPSALPVPGPPSLFSGFPPPHSQGRGGSPGFAPFPNPATTYPAGRGGGHGRGAPIPTSSSARPAPPGAPAGPPPPQAFTQPARAPSGSKKRRTDSDAQLEGLFFAQHGLHGGNAALSLLQQNSPAAALVNRTTAAQPSIVNKSLHQKGMTPLSFPVPSAMLPVASYIQPPPTAPPVALPSAPLPLQHFPPAMQVNVNEEMEEESEESENDDLLAQSDSPAEDQRARDATTTFRQDGFVFNFHIYPVFYFHGVDPPEFVFIWERIFSQDPVFEVVEGKKINISFPRGEFSGSTFVEYGARSQEKLLPVPLKGQINFFKLTMKEIQRIEFERDGKKFVGFKTLVQPQTMRA